jgi:hypothetical protein
MAEKPSRMFSKELARKFGTLYGPNCTFIENEDGSEWTDEKKNEVKKKILGGEWTDGHADGTCF